MEGEKLPSKLNVDTDIICSMEDGEGRYGSKVVRKRVIYSVLGVPNLRYFSFSAQNIYIQKES